MQKQLAAKIFESFKADETGSEYLKAIKLLKNSLKIAASRRFRGLSLFKKQSLLILGRRHFSLTGINPVKFFTKVYSLLLSGTPASSNHGFEFLQNGIPHLTG